MTRNTRSDLQSLIAQRYSDAPDVVDVDGEVDLLTSMLGRGSCRAFQDRPVSVEFQELLCAAAFASPTKSDLQGRDVVLLRSPELRAQLAGLVSGQEWVAQAPMMAVFCGNHRRQRLVHDWHDVPFANDHVDAMFNAAGDAAIALGAFVTAAEALGLGCCPISAVRNEAQAVSDLLGLPSHVFPFAGLAFGYPSRSPRVSKRLPLGVTCHVDQYQEADLREQIEAYDVGRASVHPYRQQKFEERFGTSEAYGWSEDKARQYSVPERADFGAYLRARGFRLE